jgi:methionyl-tRNA synthetase
VLVYPYSVLTKTTPELRDSEHVFFLLGKQQSVLKQWLESSSLQAPIRNKLLEWFEHGLKDWDISRDAPYFGFTIPGYEDKYFYVWVDAPMGYIAGLKHLLTNQGKQELCDQICSPESDWEMHHFIGKDIIYFHGLFWPAILQAAEYRMPTALHAHGFLTIDGQKMSKSRGTFITAKQYHEKLSPEYLRYYFAGKLNDGVGDMDLAWDDFTARCNADLIGKIINIGSRCAGFIHKHFSGKTASSLECEKLFTTLAEAQDGIAHAYDAKQFSAAMRQIIQLADGVNQYIDQKKPWVMIKEEGQKDHVHKVCTSALTAFHQLMIYLSPVLPDTAAKTASFFMQEALTWQALTEPLLDRQITPFPRMLERITKEDCPIDQAQSA